MKERRQYPRFDTLNFVFFILSDKGEVQLQDMGRTLDASERGLLIQTAVPLAAGMHLKLSIAFADQLFEATGDVVHSVEDGEGLFNSGVSFDPLTAEQQVVLNCFLESFPAVSE
ncbi:MAG: PilZ domain-containing protein [Desulfuromonadaceae bacterium]|nr:PilZ domain-containing protein [Desulfuromonadaceae bacterium]